MKFIILSILLVLISCGGNQEIAVFPLSTSALSISELENLSCEERQDHLAQIEIESVLREFNFEIEAINRARNSDAREYGANDNAPTSGKDTNNRDADVDELDTAMLTEDYLYKSIERRFIKFNKDLTVEKEIDLDAPIEGFLASEEYFIVKMKNGSLNLLDQSLKVLKKFELENVNSKLRLLDNQLLIFDGNYGDISGRFQPVGNWCGTVWPGNYRSEVDAAELMEKMVSEITRRTKEIKKEVKEKYSCDMEYRFVGEHLGNKTQIKSIDLTEQKLKKHMTYFSSGVEFLVDKENIFMFFRKNNEKSSIDQISLKDNFKIKNEFTVKGNIPNQFFIDRKETYLRVGSYISGSRASRRSQLTIFNLVNGEQVSEVPNLGVGEELFSMQFKDDLVLLLTSTTIKDPLYVIDVSLANDPKILDSFEQPGFNDYLKFFNNYLIGIGQDEERTPKLDLFEINEEGKVALLDQHKFKGVEIPVKQSDAEYFYKSIYLNSNSSLLALPVVSYGNDQKGDGYIIYKLTESEDSVELKEVKEVQQDIDVMNSRVLSDDESLYFISNKGIKKLRLEDLSLEDAIYL